MVSINELVGKRVFDGTDTEIAVVDGLNVTFPDSKIYLRVKGDSLMKIRGRRNEFIPIGEIDLIEKDICLYKEFKTLGNLIKKIEMGSKETYRVRDFLGMDVRTSDDIDLGTVADMFLTDEKRELKLMIEGYKIKAIRGRSQELVDFDEVNRIEDDIEVGIPYSMLAERIKES